ncbi:MAG: flagellar motor protein MotB [Pseudobdellovibrionaceae bacterium]
MSGAERKSSLFNKPDGADHPDNMESDHIDERWLISYSDMMTLLFGLFVMLYAIAMETQGKPETVFSDLVAGKEQKAAATDKQTINQLNKELSSTKNSLAIKTEQLAKLMDKLTEHSRSLDDAKKESEKSKELQAALEAQIKDLQEKLEASGTNTASKNLAEKKNSKLQSQIAELKSQLEKKNAELQKNMELQKQQEDSLKVGAASAAEVLALKKKIAEQQEEIQKLLARLQLVIKENLDSFMMVVLKWTSDKHDLDLTVTDPNDHVYNFKKRTYPNTPSKFVLDSRSGPGVEMWQTQKLIPGDYKIDFVFYNNYGNELPADVSGSIITKKGEIPIPSFKMDFSKSKVKSFKLTISPEGNVSLK